MSSGSGSWGNEFTNQWIEDAEITSSRQQKADDDHQTSLMLTNRLAREYRVFKESEAHLDPSNIEASKVLYEMNQGKPWDGDDKGIVDYGVAEMGRFNHSFYQSDTPSWWSDVIPPLNHEAYMDNQDNKGMVAYFEKMASEDTTNIQKLSFLHMMEQYTAMDADNWNEVKRWAGAAVSDSANFLGVGPLAAAGFKWGGKKIGKNAFIEKIKDSLKMSTVAAVDGAAFTGIYSGLNQEVTRAAMDNQYLDPSSIPEHDYVQDAVMAGIGATAAVGLVNAPAMAKKIWDGTGYIVDKTYKPGQLNSGFGPTDGPDMTPSPDAPITPDVLTDMPHPLGPKVREIADQRIAIDQEAANLQAQKNGGKAKKIAQRVKIDDLAKAFDADHIETYGRKLDPTVPEDQELAAKVIAKEIDLQMTQANSGAGWYDADVEKTFKLLGETPGLESLKSNETHRIIWSALSAPTSIGQKVIGNTKASTAAALTYFRTGEIPTVAPKAGATTEGIANAGWGFKQKSVEPGMKVISALIKKHGEEGFADWWLSPHSLKELTAIRKEAGLGGAPTGLSGGKDSIHLGAMVLGDKTGRFSLNINGYEGTTKDVWYSRSYNRAFGQMFGANDPKTGLPVVQGGPRNQTERREMEAFNQLVLYNTKLEGLSEADAQAVLWFYEQGLYSRLGVQSRPGSFSEGVGEVHGSLGIRQAVRGSDGSEIEIESPADLENFRDISGKQRTLRANRRDAQSGVDNGLGNSQESSPYQRKTIETNGRDGLLSFSPDPDTLAKYQSAGLSLPNINQVDSASSAASYNADMTSAMSGHSLGAQVEIKSAEDLASSNLFRTESGSGFAIKPDGDIVAVFASPSEPKGGSYSMLQAAVQAGGKKLDAFDTYLPDIYESVGFRPVARLPWNDEFAPPGWDKNAFSEYNNGEPDVVFFVHDAEYFGGATDVPVVTNYDDAVRLQNEASK